MTIGRRSILASIAGCGGFLILEGVAHSSGRADRTASIEIVGDERAYLRLAAPSLSGRRPLEDGETYPDPHTLEVGNLLTDPIDVTLSSTAGVLAFDGQPSLTVPTLDPGDAVPVTIAVESGPTATDTVRVTARGTDGEVFVDIRRTITLESPSARTVELSLCRGRSGNCVDLTVALHPTAGEVGQLSVTGAVALPRENAMADTNGVQLLGLPATVDLQFDAYGSSEAGNWRVSRLAGQGTLNTRPGEEVKTQLGSVQMTIDPSGAGGPTERVSVTVHPED